MIQQWTRCDNFDLCTVEDQSYPDRTPGLKPKVLPVLNQKSLPRVLPFWNQVFLLRVWPFWKPKPNFLLRVWPFWNDLCGNQPVS